MQRFLLSSSPPFLLLSLLFLSSFHGHLISAQVFNFPSGKMDKNSLSLQHGSVDSSGTLTLDASTGDAHAFYSQPISLLDSAGSSVLSFSSFFTFASNATNGNGTIVFVFTPDDVLTGPISLVEGRKTLTIEFNTSCSPGGPYGGGGRFYGGRGFQGRGGYYGGGGGFFGGLGGFQVAEYTNSTSISPNIVSGYGPGWSNQPPQGSGYFCSQQPPQDLSNPTFQYQVAFEYNASTDTISIGSPSCGNLMARTTQFNAKDLSGIITKPVYVGFLVTGGGIFNISQWNFTSNSTTSSVSNLALSSAFSTSSGSGSGMGHSNRGLKKGYIIAFSVLGAAIGVAAVLLACCLCARRRRVTSARFVGSKSVYEGTIPESAVVFDAKKPHAPPAKVVLVEKDTAPLNTRPNSAFNGSTGAASWLQPVAPR